MEIAEVCDRLEFNIWYTSAMMLIYCVVSSHAATATVIFCLHYVKQFSISINKTMKLLRKCVFALCIAFGNRIARCRHVSSYNI